MAQKSANHSTFDTHYHIVFPIKYRKAILSLDVCKVIVELAKLIEDRYDIKFEEIGTDGDHIHLLCSFKPSLSGSDVVRIFKSITGRELFKQFPQLRKELWGGELWSDGYYISTLGEKGGLNTVKNYIKNQGKTISDNQINLFEKRP